MFDFYISWKYIIIYVFMDEFILEVEVCLFVYWCICYGCFVVVDYVYGVFLY